MSSVPDISDIVSKLSKNLAFNVWVPSLDREFLFKPPTAGDQKKLLSAAWESKTTAHALYLAISNLIKNSSADGEFDFKKINIYDKFVIALQLRAYGINDKVTLEYVTESKSKDEPAKTFKKEINLIEHIEKIKKEYVSPKSVSVEQNDFKVIIEVPDVVSDDAFSNYTVNILKSVDSNTQKDAIKAVAVILKTFGHTETALFVSSLNIKELSLDMRTYEPVDRISIIEKLPWKVTSILIEEKKNRFTSQMEKLDLLVDNFQDEDKNEVSATAIIDYRSLFM